MNSVVEEILRGSYDLHVHAGPDPDQERRMDFLDVGRYAHEAEMAGFVLKSHHYPTAPLAHAVNRIYPGLKAAGGVVLNRAVGGINPDAVQASANMEARVVWMPTFDADGRATRWSDGATIRITDDTGALLPVVHDILDVVKEHDMVLASGHLSATEAIALFSAARETGIDRLLATHPMFNEGASAEAVAAMAALGARIEINFLPAMPSQGLATFAQLVEQVHAIGPDHCVVTTDFGQWNNPPPAEGMRMAISALLSAGVVAQDVERLVKVNPRELVGV